MKLATAGKRVFVEIMCNTDVADFRMQEAVNGLTFDYHAPPMPVPTVI